MEPSKKDKLAVTEKSLGLTATVHVNKVVHLLLLLSFVGVCANSLRKVLEGTWTKTLSSVGASELEPPSYTGCAIVWVEEEEAAKATFNPQRLLDDFQTKMEVIGGSLADRVDVTRVWLPKLNDRFLVCFTHEISNFSALETLQGRQVVFSLEWKEDLHVEHVWYLLHDRRQYFQYEVPALGSDFVPAKPGVASYRKYTVAVAELAPDGESGCRRDSLEGSLMDCVMGHVQGRMGCSLAWVKKGSAGGDDDDGAEEALPEPCDFGQDETAGRYEGILSGVRTLNVAGVADLTGCRVACTYQEFVMRPLEGRDLVGAAKNRTSMQFVAVAGDDDVSVRTDTLMYGWMDLVAEVGGYMGLLLGASILSIYDFAMEKARDLACTLKFSHLFRSNALRSV